jgi:hypothetical protein
MVKEEDMGFWNFKKNQNQGFLKSENINKESNEEKKEPEKELTEEDLIEQLVEKSISHILSLDSKIDNGYSKYSRINTKHLDEKIIRSFQAAKQLLQDISCMDLFKKAARQYTTIWKSITGKPCSDSNLYVTIEDAILNLGSLHEFGMPCDTIKESLQANASGKFDLVNEIGHYSIFNDPVQAANFKHHVQAANIEIKNIEKNIEAKFEQERLLREKIKKLKEIVNKPIKYGDVGNSEEINFDDEFNVFAEKLREQKMDEITIFKLVSRMGELKKQYESVIKHPDRSLLERIEAQVLLEFYEQVMKQKEEQEEKERKELEEQTRQIEAGMQVGTVSDSINNIEKDVSTLTWLKIIDGLFGH